MKRLLAISWALPPILKPRSLQVARVLKALAPLGWEIDVISVEPRGSITARPLDNELEAHYNEAYSVYRSRETLGQIASLFLGNLFPALRSLPDAQRGWLRSATDLGLRLSSENQYDVLLSFAQPWSCHLVALAIHKASGLPWVAHFSDPWADNPYYASFNDSQRARMLAWEGEVVATASRLIFTNRQTAGKMMAKYPKEWSGKTAVVSHAFDESLLPPAAEALPNRPHLQLAYTGNLYGLRSAETLIRALALVQERDKLRIRIAGSVKHKKNYEKLAGEIGVSEIIEFVGQLNYQDSLRLLADAEALLLIDAPSAKESLFLPSKLIDYLMFAKPILGITPLQGASAELLQKLRCPVVSPEDVAGLASEVEKLLASWSQGKLALYAGTRNYVQEYSSDVIANQFDVLLNTLLNTSA